MPLSGVAEGLHIFWLVEEGALVKYERIGECKRCGQCCQEGQSIQFEVEVSTFCSDQGDGSYENTGDWSKWGGILSFVTMGCGGISRRGRRERGKRVSLSLSGAAFAQYLAIPFAGLCCADIGQSIRIYCIPDAVLVSRGGTMKGKATHPEQMALDFGEVQSAGDSLGMDRIEELCLTNPHVSHFYLLYRRGEISREEALVGMVLSLSRANQKILAAMGKVLEGRSPMGAFRFGGV